MAPRKSKRKPGPPARYGYRPTLTIRLQEALYDTIKKAAGKHGKSLSEEIEDTLEASRNIDRLRTEAEQRLADARRLLREANAVRDAAHVQAIRDAGFAILREFEGQPSRVIISTERLLAEAAQVFIPAEQPAPLQKSDAEIEAELAEVRRMAADATKASGKSDEAA
jgi:hypothetical protein